MGVASDITRKLPDPLALIIFPLLLQSFLSLKCGNILRMYSLGLGSTALHFDGLWLSVVVSLAKEKFH